MIRLGIAIAGVVAFITADVAGYGWAVFVLLGSACATVAGFVLWHLFGPARERAHLRYRARVSARPKPAAEWALPEPEPVPYVKPARSNVTPRPGRRMVALLPNEQPVKQAPQ